MEFQKLNMLFLRKQSAFQNMNIKYKHSVDGVGRCSFVSNESKMFRVYCNMLICHLLFANKLFLESAYKVQTTQTTSKIVGDNVRSTNNVSFAPRWVGAINQTTFNPFISAKHVQKRLGPPWQILMCTVEIWVENNSHFQKLNSPSQRFTWKELWKSCFLQATKIGWIVCEIPEEEKTSHCRQWHQCSKIRGIPVWNFENFLDHIQRNGKSQKLRLGNSAAHHLFCFFWLWCESLWIMVY